MRNTAGSPLVRKRAPGRLTVRAAAGADGVEDVGHLEGGLLPRRDEDDPVSICIGPITSPMVRARSG